MPEPDTPVTAVSTPMGKAASRRCRLLQVMPVSFSQPRGGRTLPSRGRGGAKRCRAVCESGTRRRPAGGPLYSTRPAVFARFGSHVHDPVGVLHHGDVVFDHEQRIAGALEPVQRRQQRHAVGGVQARGRLVQHVEHAKEVGVDLRRQPHALQFAGRQGGRLPVERQIAQADVLQGLHALQHVLGNALRSDALLFRLVGRSQHVGGAFVARARGRVTAGAAPRCGRRCRRGLGPAHGRRFEHLRELGQW